MDTWGDLVISGDVVRGSRIGAGPVREADHGPGAPRVTVSFWCANRHQTRPNFAADAAVPETWECPRCGGPAGQDERHPPARPRIEPFRTHLAYVKERRSQADGEAILAEALARLHGARQPFVPASPAEACAAADEGRPDPAGPRQAAAGDQRAPATAALPAAGAETRSGRDQDLPRPPGRPGAPGRRGAGGASSRSRPGRREDQGPRPAETAPCPGQPDANPDPLGADAPARPHPQPSLGPAPHAGAPPRAPAGKPPGRTDPAPPGPADDEWCNGCGYKLTAPGHEEHLRAVALGRSRRRPATSAPTAPRARSARPAAT